MILQQSETIMALFTVLGHSPYDNMPIEKTLLKADHPLTTLLIYMFSMESYLYKEMSTVSLCKDVKQVDSFGPINWTLQQIFSRAEEKRRDKVLGTLTVYRGQTMTPEECAKFKI